MPGGRPATAPQAAPAQVLSAPGRPPARLQETPALDLPLGLLGPEDDPVAQVARGRVGLWCGVTALWYR